MARVPIAPGFTTFPGAIGEVVMRRLFSKLVICLSVLAVATPATLAAAGESEQLQTRTPTARVSVRQSAVRVAASLADQKGMTAPSASAIAKHAGTRMQMIGAGGGGKGPMIMGIVSGVLGVAMTVYMMKMIKENQQKDQ